MNAEIYSRWTQSEILIHVRQSGIELKDIRLSHISACIFLPCLDQVSGLVLIWRAPKATLRLLPVMGCAVRGNIENTLLELGYSNFARPRKCPQDQDKFTRSAVGDTFPKAYKKVRPLKLTISPSFFLFRANSFAIPWIIYLEVWYSSDSPPK